METRATFERAFPAPVQSQQQSSTSQPTTTHEVRVSGECDFSIETCHSLSTCKVIKIRSYFSFRHVTAEENGAVPIDITRVVELSVKATGPDPSDRTLAFRHCVSLIVFLLVDCVFDCVFMRNSTFGFLVPGKPLFKADTANRPWLSTTTG